VLTVKMTSITVRPSVHLGACAPVSANPSSFPATAVFRVRADRPVTVAGSVTVDTPRFPQVHQAQAQAELALAAVRTRGDNGTNGFTVTGITEGAKRLMVVARGVPPRGRPV
jgi:hypothetical protein